MYLIIATTLTLLANWSIRYGAALRMFSPLMSLPARRPFSTQKRQRDVAPGAQSRTSML